jgi:hypothetical protein
LYPGGYGYGGPKLIPPSLFCGPVGFAAAKGWDPASGLGTPNYPRLQAVVEALP